MVRFKNTPFIKEDKRIFIDNIFECPEELNFEYQFFKRNDIWYLIKVIGKFTLGLYKYNHEILNFELINEFDFPEEVYEIWIPKIQHLTFTDSPNYNVYTVMDSPFGNDNYWIYENDPDVDETFIIKEFYYHKCLIKGSVTASNLIIVGEFDINKLIDDNKLEVSVYKSNWINYNSPINTLFSFEYWSPKNDVLGIVSAEYGAEKVLYNNEKEEN